MKYYGDFNIGDKKTTRGRTVTETDIILFSAFSGDWYPIHVDAEYAKKSQFGERIAHGFCVLSIASGLMPLYDEAIIALYGIDKVRFYKPTMIGDTIHLEIEYVDKEDKKGGGGVVHHDIKVVNQRGEVVAGYILRGLIGGAPETNESR